MERVENSSFRTQMVLKYYNDSFYSVHLKNLVAIFFILILITFEDEGLSFFENTLRNILLFFLREHSESLKVQLVFVFGSAEKYLHSYEYSISLTTDFDLLIFVQLHCCDIPWYLYHFSYTIYVCYNHADRSASFLFLHERKFVYWYSDFWAC